MGSGYAYARWQASLPKFAVVHYVQTDQPVVALTFDDGPHPVFTPEVLAVLRRYGVPGTFFMMGKQMEKHPELVEQALREGHTIGNHTYSHPHLRQKRSQDIAQEFERTENLIVRFTRHRSHLLRPPYGEYNERVCDFARQHRYRIVQWVVCAENRLAPTPEAMAQRVLDKVRPGGIILAHDGTSEDVLDRTHTVQSLPLIIEGLQKKGYRFVTLPTLLTYGAADDVGLCHRERPATD